MKRIYLKLFFKNNILITISILTNILLSISIIIGTYKQTIYKECYNNTNNSESYRTLYYEPTIDNVDKINVEIKKIKQIDHVLDVFDNHAYIEGGIIKEFANDTFSGLTELHTASNKTLPKIIKGKDFPDDEDYYMICPTIFFPGAENLYHTSRLSSIDLSDKIGTIYKYTYNIENNEYINIKLIGLYNPQASDLDSERACYTNKKILKTIYTNNMKYKKNKCYKECLDNCKSECNFEEEKTYVIVLDDKKEKNNVISKLNKLGIEITNYEEENKFYVNEFYQTRINNLDKFLKWYLILFSILVTLLTFIIMNYIYKISNKIKKLGYDNKKIFFYNTYVIFCNIIINILFSLIIINIIKIIIKTINYLYPLIFEKMEIIFDYSYYYKFIYIYIIVIILSLLVTNFFIKKGDEQR